MIYLDHNVSLVFCQLKFNVCVRWDMAFIESMHRNNPVLHTYLLTYQLASTPCHVTRPCHFRDMPISNSDLENKKGLTYFSKSHGESNILSIRSISCPVNWTSHSWYTVVWKFGLKTQHQDHGWDQSSVEYSESHIISTPYHSASRCWNEAISKFDHENPRSSL